MKPDRCGSRRRKHAFTTAAFVTAAAILTLAANAGSIIADSSMSWRKDISQQQYTVLTQQSKDVIGRLNKDIYLYYTGDSELDDLRVTTLLKNYAASSKHVSFRLVDPIARQGFTQLYDPGQTGIEKGSVIVSDSDGLSGAVPKRYKVISKDELYDSSAPYYNEAGALVSDYRYFSAEQRITSAIDYIMTDKNMSVIFLDGQGESAPCGGLLNDLSARYYETRTSNLKDIDLDPQNETLVVISPQTDLGEQTFGKIEAFLAQGGKAVFLMDMVQSGLGTQTQTRFDTLLNEFGLTVQRNVVVGDDPRFTYMSRMSLTPLLSETSPITASIAKEGLSPVLSYAGVVTVLSVPGGSATELLNTDKTSYAKSSCTDLDKCSKQDGDEQGPFTIGALAQKGDAAVVVFGSSLFVSSDQSYSIPGNRQLMMNTIGYLNGRQDNALIPMRTIYSAADNAYKLGISSEIEKVFLIGLTAVAIPLAVVLTGVSKWLRRRRQQP